MCWSLQEFLECFIPAAQTVQSEIITLKVLWNSLPYLLTLLETPVWQISQAFMFVATTIYNIKEAKEITVFKSLGAAVDAYDEQNIW